jgi:sigma-B regulation protein RsbU (phosphoserine phosphatase)
MRILIADDDPVSRHLLQRTLEGWNYAVTAVDNGNAAWEAICGGEFHRVILDWVMPGVDGPELVRRIRARPLSGYVYTILLAASNDHDEFVEGLSAGADDFMVKPLHREELWARMRTGERILALEETLRDQNRRLEERNREMEADLRMACEVQQALLPQGYPSFPRGLPPERSRLRFFDRYRPNGAVGGDFFDVIPLSDSRAGVLICDVIGHGVRAALGTAMIRALLENFRRLADEPSHFLEEMNRELLAILGQASVPVNLSAFYGMIDLDAWQLHYASAAHPAPVLARGEQAQLLPPPGGQVGPPLGVREHSMYPHASMNLCTGDRLVFYTDGLIEAINPSEEAFGAERLCEAIKQRQSMGCGRMFDEILSEVTRFTQGRGLDDDVCLVGADVR